MKTSQKDLEPLRGTPETPAAVPSAGPISWMMKSLSVHVHTSWLLSQLIVSAVRVAREDGEEGISSSLRSNALTRRLIRGSLSLRLGRRTPILVWLGSDVWSVAKFRDRAESQLLQDEASGEVQRASSQQQIIKPITAGGGAISHRSVSPLRTEILMT